jgi:hypothetical protein
MGLVQSEHHHDFIERELMDNTAFLAYTSSGTFKAKILEHEAIVQLPSG